MRTSIRSVAKVHFPALFPPQRRRWPLLGPPLRSVSPSRRAAPPGAFSPPVSAGHAAAPCHGGISRQDEAWLHSLRPWAVGLARRAGLFGADVDDAVQSAFLRVFTTWGQFEPPVGQPEQAARRGWVAGLICTTAAEIRLQVVRERKRRSLDLDGQVGAATTESHEPRLIARDSLRELEQATTPDRWRVWTAYRVEQVPVAEIARQEGRPAPTIYNLVRLARRDFTAALRREAGASKGPLVPRRGRKVRP